MTELQNPCGPTRVTFPMGGTAATTRILHIHPHRDDPNRVVVLTEVSPFHPVAPTWRDQPADRGSLAITGMSLAVVDCVTGAWEIATGRLLFDQDIPSRSIVAGWSFVVAHLIELPGGTAVPLQLRQEVTLRVCEWRRNLLSAAHTGCHLMSLALNQATAALWRKGGYPRDSLGQPDLDRIAIDRSEIKPGESLDRYRFGKSLHKKGFDRVAFFDRMPALEDAMNTSIARWVATGAEVAMTYEGDTLTARRRWTCQLPDGLADIPCGGTHLTFLSRLRSVRVTLVPAADGQGVDARTRVELAGGKAFDGTLLSSIEGV